jgi:hypothetical protein
MMTARASAPARAGLLGNPSDVDDDRFGWLDELVADVRANGYYGGVRLVKVALKGRDDRALVAGGEGLAHELAIVLVVEQLNCILGRQPAQLVDLGAGAESPFQGFHQPEADELRAALAVQVVRGR